MVLGMPWTHWYRLERPTGTKETATLMQAGSPFGTGWFFQLVPMSYGIPNIISHFKKNRSQNIKSIDTKYSNHPINHMLQRIVPQIIQKIVYKIDPIHTIPHAYLFLKNKKKREKIHPQPAPVRRRPAWTSSSRGSASPRPRASWAAHPVACGSWPASRALPRELLADAPRVLCLGPRVLLLARLPCARTEGRKGKNERSHETSNPNYFLKSQQFETKLELQT